MSVLVSWKMNYDGTTRLGGDVVLAGTTARPLAGHDDAGDDELATPDAPWLTPREGLGEAPGAERAGDAQGLGGLDVGRGLGEEQVRVLGPAGQDSVGRVGQVVG